MPDEVVVGEMVSCDSLYTAEVLVDTIDSFVTGTPEYLAPLGEVKYDPKVSDSSSDYDGKTMFRRFSEAGESSLSIPGLSEKKKAKYTGKSYDAATGRVYDDGDLSRAKPRALGYRIELDEGVYAYFWFLKGYFKFGAITAKSKGQKIDGQGTEITFLPVNTIHKWEIPNPDDPAKTIIKSQKIVSADTTDANFTTETAWFAQVQTPTAGGTVSAITVTSVPANNATAVLATAKPTLTFNNVIAEDAVLLIKASDNSIVPITKSYDATGKILTLTPSTNLTASGVYNIIIAGVKDVFGQSLAASSIKFTVAS